MVRSRRARGIILKCFWTAVSLPKRKRCPEILYGARQGYRWRICCFIMLAEKRVKSAFRFCISGKKPDMDRFCSRFFPIDDCGVGSEIVKSKKIFVKGIRFSGFFPFEKPAAMEYNKDIE